ncbi:hypothetical protein AAE02nite_31910 [Adhaeribacter aerolatus]|uniref:Uncharacterized protein n=1 Tax=Adhaeribacter aerolatus TaxID=670289 RepID=A0A512B157_9BACT|nr:hypothetical protein [Adhaeribacter aerolatus]GEO05527.1 hypothetical protein AAE02nite_31910 [Adhaeribacter aerolatus]
MIKVKHPDESCNQIQETFLAKCPAEERRFHELLFTHGNISYRYHQEAKEFNPTVKDFEEWLEGLPENMRHDMQQRGFEACKGILSFTRYVNEKNDIGLDEYVRQQMGSADFAEYQSFLTNG